MPNTTSKRVLLTLNAQVSGKYGKYSRIIKLAELFDLMGFHVNLMVSESTSKVKNKHFSNVETKVNLSHKLSSKLLTRIKGNMKQSIMLSSVYLKILFCGDRYDIIVSSNVGPPIDPLLACMLSKCMKVPFIYDYDDLNPEGAIVDMGWGKWNPYVILLFQLERILCSSSKLTLVVGKKMRNLVSRSVDPRKVVVLYNTVSASASAEYCVRNRRPQPSLPKDKIILTYAGLIKPKVLGLEDFIVAFSRVDSEVKERILILLIGAVDRYMHNMIHQLGLQNNVRMLGPLERQEVLSVLRMSNLSIIPSPPQPRLTVIAPTKFFEAMSLGLPVLAPKAGELPLILGEEYPYYYDRTPSGLNCALGSVLNDKKRLKLVGQKLRELFEERYSWECHREQLLPVIHNFLFE